VCKASVGIEGARVPSRLLFDYQKVCDTVSDQKVCDVVCKASVGIEGARVPSRLLFNYQKVCDAVCRLACRIQNKHIRLSA
jgi:hypothetical protein